MPLHGHDQAIRALEGLDDAVLGVGGEDEALTRDLDGLMVQRVGVGALGLQDVPKT